MTDERTPFPSDEELGRALKSKMRPCPMCAGATWHTGHVTVALPTQDGTDGAVQIEAKDDADRFTIAGAVALPVICGECGYIALFHLDTLLGRGLNAPG